MAEIHPGYLDYVKVLFYVRRWQVLKWIAFSIIPYMFLLLYYRFPEGKEVSSATMVVLAITVVAFWVFIWFLFNLYHSHLAHHHAKKEKHIPFRFEADENGVLIITNNIKSEIKWNTFKKITETKYSFLLWYDRQHYHFLPKQFIPDIEKLKSTIERNYSGKKKIKMKKI
jgi:hypothetical protein